jgi:flagellar biogenesis protein FliO
VNPWFQLLAILLLYGVLFYVWYVVKTRRGFGAWFQKSVAQSEIQVVESKPIAPRTQAILLKVRDQSLLVIQSPQGIQMAVLDKEAPSSAAAAVENKQK